jgi:uncharacterized membrane protein YGL010W
MKMLGNRSADQWVSEYAKSHQHPVNRVCHTIGIPMIAASVPLFAASPWVPGLWPLPTGMFVVGWALQFVGHYYEQKPPEFFRDPRFLLVGLRWWLAKLQGKA